MIVFLFHLEYAVFVDLCNYYRIRYFMFMVWVIFGVLVFYIDEIVDDVVAGDICM